MSEAPEQPQTEQDPTPAPLKHVDAERVSDEEPQSPEETEKDPAENPSEEA